MADAWFVDETINVLRGAAAEEAIRTRSDARFLSDDGIVRVTPERWKIAQTFERTGWMEKWHGATDDRNLMHAEEYNGYRSLTGRSFEHAIELGCGPFTNLRVIADFVEINRVTLLDPLLESYLQLPKCRYAQKTLRTHSGDRTLPVSELLACPIEQMPTARRQHDLVVMMNVIEHCYDVEIILEKILAILAPGGVFIFHDSIYDVKKTRELIPGKYYEAGHPLMVGYARLERFMHEHFETLYFSRMPDLSEQMEVCPHVGQFYYISRRR